VTPRSRPRPATVYAIADVALLGGEKIVYAITTLADCGIGTIQLRAKAADDAELWAWSELLEMRLAGWDGELWIDDRADLARVGGYAGVHLGQRDLPAATVREQLGERIGIGCSTHDEAQLASAAEDDAVDWLALGPIFATTSKTDPDPVVGLAALRRLRPRVGKPVIAIGGIDAGNLAEVLAAGADSAAVLSAICVGDLAANARRLLRAAAEAGR